MKMVPRETLLSLAKKKDAVALNEFVKTLQAESDGRLADALGGCSRQQLEAMWENLQEVCTAALGLEGMPHPNPEAEAQEMERMHMTLLTLAVLAEATLANLSKKKEFPPALLQTAIVLHGVLNSLPPEEEGVRNALAQVCETWWRLELEGREELALNALAHLLQRALAQRSTKADVRRVWAMHEFLTMVDLDNSLSDSLKQLLKRTMLHPTFLNADEGRKFLAFLFTLNEGLTRSLHATVKTQLPVVSSMWLEKYGDIYFRAWQKATEPLLKTLEKDCIQDLMCAAVHARRTGPKPLASALRKVLKVFHSQKKLKGVDEMLYRLYEPILWRALMMPNPAVRANATNIFFDAFPIQNPSANIEETDSMLQKQFDLITTLLSDPCCTVRALATQGVCRIMSVYWELIPAATLRSFLVRLVQELAWDAASAEVREATLRGLHLLLDNHHSHLVLKPVLPQLCRTVHDTAEKVRIAMLDLLLKVKGIRAIKWWLIVPVEHLLKRLEVDGAPVVRRLMRLLFNSFVPLEAGDAALLERCLVMVESNVAAARVFFQNLPKHVTITDTVNYMTMLCRWALVWARRWQQLQQDQSSGIGSSVSLSPRPTLKDGATESNIEREAEEEEEEEEEKKDKEEVEKVEVLAGVLEILVILWTTVSSKLSEPGMAEQKEGLQKKLSILIPEVLKTAEDARAWRACVLLAARLPPAAIPTLSRSFHSRLRRLEPGAAEEDYDTMLEAMCKWRKADDVLELINDWLSSALAAPPTPRPAAAKGQPGRRKVAIVDPQTPQPDLALCFLRFLTRNVLCQTILLQQHAGALGRTQALLRRAKDVIAERMAGLRDPASDPSDSFLLSAFSSYLMLLVIRHSSSQAAPPPPQSQPAPRKGRGRPRQNQSGSSGSEGGSGGGGQVDTQFLAELEELLDWAADRLLPPLTAGHSADPAASVSPSSSSASSASSASRRGKRSSVSEPQPPPRKLCGQLLQELLRLCGNALLALALPQQFVDKVSALCVACLDQVAVAEGYALFEALLECLYRCVELRWVGCCQTESAGRPMEEAAGWLEKVYTATARALQQQPQLQQELLGSTQGAVGEMAAAVLQTHSLPGLQETGGGAATRLMASTVAAMLEDLDRASRRLDLERDPVTSDLQPLTGWLLTAVGKSKASRRLLVETLLNSVRAEDKPSAHRLHSHVHLLHCLLTGSGKEAGLADCVAAVKEQFDRRRGDFLPRQGGDDSAMEEDEYLRPVVEMISEKLSSCQKKL